MLRNRIRDQVPPEVFDDGSSSLVMSDNTSMDRDDDGGGDDDEDAEDGEARAEASGRVAEESEDRSATPLSELSSNAYYYAGTGTRSSGKLEPRTQRTMFQRRKRKLLRHHAEILGLHPLEVGRFALVSSSARLLVLVVACSTLTDKGCSGWVRRIVACPATSPNAALPPAATGRLCLLITRSLTITINDTTQQQVQRLLQPSSVPPLADGHEFGIEHFAHAPTAGGLEADPDAQLKALCARALRREYDSAPFGKTTRRLIVVASGRRAYGLKTALLPVVVPRWSWQCCSRSSIDACIVTGPSCHGSRCWQPLHPEHSRHAPAAAAAPAASAATAAAAAAAARLLQRWTQVY
jgi:hypothetical protein